MGVYYSNDSGENHICGINSGVAHVGGREILYPHSKEIQIRKALDVQERNSEPIIYTGNKSYPLRHTPIADIVKISGIKTYNQRAITHGVPSGSDDLTIANNGSSMNISLENIISVSADPSGNNKYIEGIDYFKDGNYINWGTSSTHEPSSGSTYYVTYRYRTTEGVEYYLDEDRLGVIITGLTSGTTAYVDYTHYLDRVDSVVLLSDGSVSIVKGSPSEYNPVAQNVTNGLVLSTVLLRYGLDPYFYNDSFRAYKNSDLTNIKNAIFTLQYNLAQLDLATDINSRDPSSTKDGMFVDPFYDNDQRDEGLEQNAEIVDKVLLPQREWNIYTVRTGNDITLVNSGNTYLVNQPYRTKSRKINEYMVMSDTPLAYISVSPQTYRWAATFSQVTELKWATTGRMTAAHIAAGWKEWGGLRDFPNYKIRYSASGGHYYDDADYRANYSTAKKQVSDLSRLTMTSYNYITTELASSVSSDISGTYVVPQFDLDISGSSFNKGESVNIKIDGKSVGSLPADNSGNISGILRTPYGMKSGKKSIVATGTVSGASATTTFSTIPQNQSNTYYEYHSAMYDPIGQTFLNESDCFASSVELMFAKAPTSAVELRITETSGGYPDPEKTIASKVLNPNNISIGSWVTFTFPSPVYLEANKYYAIALVSSEAQGEVYVAELGKRDNWNNYWVTKNIFNGGTLVQASNAYTWNAVQNEDMTFRISRCKFSTTSTTTTLGTVNIPSDKPINQLYLLSDSRIYPNTSVDYTINMTGVSETIPVSGYEILELNNKFTGTITVKANLKSSSNMMTPYISGDVQLATATTIYPSTYISRQFKTKGRYVKLYVDVLEYGTDQITFQYQDGDGGSWIDFNNDFDLYPDSQLGNNWVTRTFFKDTGVDVLPTRIKITFNNVEVSSISLPAVANLRLVSSKMS